MHSISRIEQLAYNEKTSLYKLFILCKMFGCDAKIDKTFEVLQLGMSPNVIRNVNVIRDVSITHKPVII